MKKSKPFFSVIIPALNEEKYLPLLLKCLAGQTFSGFEVIVVDGNSGDKTVKKAKSFKKDLALTIINAKKRNVSWQRNLGAKNALGKYLLFLDADSLIPDFFLRQLHDELDKKPADVFTASLRVKSRNPVFHLFAAIANLFVSISPFGKYPIANGACLGCSVKAWQKIGGFDRKVYFAEDSDFVRRATKAGLAYIVYKRLYYYFSLRRIKKEGLRKFIPKLIKGIWFVRVINRPLTAKTMVYRMGGK